MAVLEDLAALITAAIPAETTIAYDSEPATPARVLTLYLVGGPQAGGTLDGAAVRERTVQCRVRDPASASAHTRLEALHALFAAQRPFAGYMGIIASSETFFGYPRDAGGNVLGSFNVRVLGG